MSDEPNVYTGDPAALQMGASPVKPGATQVEKQQAEYVEGTLPIRMMKMFPGGGYGELPPGTDTSVPVPPPPPPSEVANMDDPTSVPAPPDPPPEEAP